MLAAFFFFFAQFPDFSFCFPSLFLPLKTSTCVYKALLLKHEIGSIMKDHQANGESAANEEPVVNLFPSEIKLDLDVVHGLSPDALGNGTQTLGRQRHTSNGKTLHTSRSMHQLGDHRPSPLYDGLTSHHLPSKILVDGAGDTCADAIALDRMTFQMQREEQVLHRMLEGLQGWAHLNQECKATSENGHDRHTKIRALQAGYRQHLLQCNDLYKSLLEEDVLQATTSATPPPLSSIQRICIPRMC